MGTPQRLGFAGPIVGRGEEQHAMAEAVAGAGAGHPWVVLVEGDAGMGKTALVRQVVAHLPAGTQVEQARADELAGERPFELARQLGSTATDSFGAGMELLEAWSRRQDEGPLAVVVEDLHWADTASSKALLSAVQRLDQDRVVVFITARPGLHDGWERFRTDTERCLLVTLAPLVVEEVADLAASAGVTLSPYQAQRLRTHTGGHPLYLQTLLSELSPAELQRPDGDLPAPLSLRSAVTARLSECPGPARELAAAVAVLNQRAALPLVGAIAGVDSPVGPFEELLATGFVRWDPHEPGSPVEFTHPLYRQAVYEDLPPSRRRDLHRAAARGLNSEAALTHRVAAADGVDEALAGELDKEAGRQLDLGNKTGAARTLEWASSLSASPSDRERRLIAAECVYIDASQMTRAAELRPEIESFAEGPGRSLALGLLEWDAGHVEDARLRLQQVVDGQVSDGPDARTTTARAWAELAEINIILGQAPEAAVAAAQALALSTPGTSAERLACIHRALAEGHLHGAASGLALLRERLPEAAGEVPGSEVDVLVVRATLALHAGLTHSALADLRGAVALARRGFVPVQLARCHRQLATVFTTMGQWDEALVQARTGLGIASDDPRGTVEASCHAVLATLLAYRGDLERAESHAAAAGELAARLEAVEGTAMARLAVAALGIARQDPERTIEALEPLAGAAPMMAGLAFWPMLAVAMIDAGQLERAEASIDRLEEAATARRLDMGARLTGLRARLAQATGALDKADGLFRVALDRFGPDDPFLDRALLVHAHGRLQMDRGERAEALTSLRQAQEALAAVGAEPLVSWVEADLKSRGARSGRRLARSSRELTDRERDVAVLVAKGYSNPEVASELYVSRKAIEYHLGNIYGKLGIASRRELRGISL